MRNVRSLCTLFILVFCLSSVVAQSSKLKRAQRYMDNLDYVSAIELYNQILEKEDNTDAKMLIAEAYRKINDTENAEYWYGQVVRLSEAQSVHKLYYGQMLQRNGKCDLAKEWYQNYVDEVPGDQRGQYLLRACDYEDELMTKNTGIYAITHLDINSNLDDFSPVIYKNDLIFASERDRGTAVKREHTWTGNPFLELYKVPMKMKATEDNTCAFSFERPSKFTEDLNSKFHEAGVAFSSDGNEIYFTRNNFKDGKVGEDDEGVVRLKIFYATKSGEEWGDLESLPFNSDEYSVAHPTLSTDGTKLYFASDMPGGFGGMDLYVSEKESGRWGPPLNLGPQINTEGNEIFPYYDKTDRLYFASDGHIGLGGLDIYFSENRGDSEWSLPENMGFPINTIADDLSITFTDQGTCGFFTSDRSGGVGRDDIYSFVKTAAPVQIYVYDEKTNEPIQDATILNSCTGEKLITGPNGKVIVDVKLNQCCTFTASMEGYQENAEEGCTKNLEPGETVIVEIPLNAANQIEISGVVFDQSTMLPLEDVTVTIENDCGDEIAEPFTTKASGRYTFELKEDCCYKIKATKPNFLAASADDICTKELENNEPLTQNLFLQPTSITDVTESGTGNGAGNYDDFGNGGDIITTPTTSTTSGHFITPPPGINYDEATGLYIDEATGGLADGEYQNGEYSFRNGEIVNYPGFVRGPEGTLPDGTIPYLLHIYYDFDQAYIRNDAEAELNKLYTMMLDNPGTIIEIGSHTDSRGSDTYNNRLSQRRAEGVVRWLVERGIDRDRLVPRGYGERRNVNDCVNNIPCSEREHQLNRRTEFRVLGCMDCGQAGSVLSSPNSDVQVDECIGCPF